MAVGQDFPNFTSRYMDGVSNATTLNAATDKSVMTGHVRWADDADHTISAAGGGSVKWVTGTSNTFASGSTVIEAGFQDVDTSNSSLPVRSDGTFDVKGTITGGVNTITDSTVNTVAMTTGSKALAHGQHVALVLDMISRGGSDIVRTSGLSGLASTGNSQRPTMTQFKSSAWGAMGLLPNVWFVADDGTLGIFDGAVPILSVGSESFNDSTNPDERGIIFQVPYNCTSDNCFLTVAGAAVAADSAYAIYETPLGTPSAMFTAVNILGENFERNTNNGFRLMYPKSTLVTGVDYCAALKASGASSISVLTFTLPDTNLRKFLTNDLALKKATRNNATGAFTAESPAVTVYGMAINIAPSGGGSGRNIQINNPSLVAA